MFAQDEPAREVQEASKEHGCLLVADKQSAEVLEARDRSLDRQRQPQPSAQTPSATGQPDIGEVHGTPTTHTSLWLCADK